jgi:hypothetical protein
MSNWYREIVELLESITVEESIADIDNGYMQHTKDIDGLEAHLKSMGIIPKNARILDMPNFEHAIENKRDRERMYGDAPLYGYYVNLEERGQFYADVRDEKDQTVYEIKNEDDEPEDSDHWDDGIDGEE